MLIELDPVDRITAGAVGEAGSRTFYLQARKDEQLVTLLVEKQQVQLLAASVVEILSRVGKETGQGPPEEQMTLDEPLDPEWRAGRLSIGYQEERDLLVLEVEEVLPEDEGEADSPGEPAGLGELAEFGAELAVRSWRNRRSSKRWKAWSNWTRKAERSGMWGGRGYGPRASR